MKRLATILIALLVLAPDVQAQNRYYYSDERKIPIEQAEQWTVIQIPESAQSALASALSRQSGVRLRRALNTERGFYWLEAKGQRTLGQATLDHLSRQVSIQRRIPAFYHIRGNDTTHFVMTDEFMVKFKTNVARAEIDALNERYGVEVFLKNEQDRQQARDYNEYLLRVTEASALSALEAANRYYKSALTIWSEPNFFANYRLHGTQADARAPVVPVVSQGVNDPLYDEQYYLNNTPNNLGTADVDIDAPEA